MMLDLFSHRESFADRHEKYPAAPGFKARDTSAAAAEATRPTAATLRDKCREVLRTHPKGLTADEVAGILRMSVLSIRPRISELAQSGHIKDTGNRRANDSGRGAIVWATGMQLSHGASK